MLYDPKWEKATEVKPACPTVEDLAAWLETMPANEEYLWGDIRNCALCQYIKARDFDMNWRYWHIAQILRMEPVAQARPRTFGAMLHRVRAKLADK